MTLTEVRQLLLELDLRPSKVLGQNFLIDNNILQIVAREADVRSDDVILEIGPGLGALTAELVSRAAHVFAIEKDPRLAVTRKHPIVLFQRGHRTGLNGFLAKRRNIKADAALPLQHHATLVE